MHSPRETFVKQNIGKLYRPASFHTRQGYCASAQTIYDAMEAAYVANVKYCVPALVFNQAPQLPTTAAKQRTSFTTTNSVEPRGLSPAIKMPPLTISYLLSLGSLHGAN